MMRKRFLSTAALTLLLLVLAEIGARWLRPSGTIPYAAGGEAAYQALVPELQHYGAAEVAIVGSSRAREGLPAPEVRSALEGRAKKWRVANYSLVGATGGDVEIVVKRLLEAEPPPRVIAYGVEIVAFEKGFRDGLTKKAPYIWRLSDALDARSRVGPQADRFLARAIRNSISDLSFLFRLRPEFYEALQQPTYSKLEKKLDRIFSYKGGDKNPLRGDLTKSQKGANRNVSRNVSDKHVKEYLKPDYGPGLWPNLALIERIESIATMAKAAGVELLLIEVPLSPQLQRNLPEGTLQTFYEQMEGISDRQHVPFVRVSDLDTEFPQGDFREQSHLNFKGGRKLARLWAKVINDAVN